MAKFLLVVSLIVCLLGDEAAGDAGINTVYLEDGPDRPLNAEGQPVVPADEPQEWWWDGGIVAPPQFTINGGTYLERVEVRILCATVDSTIYFNVGQNLDQIPDPTELNGMLYDPNQPIVLVRSGYIKAAGFHPFAFDSAVTISNEIRIQVPTYLPTYTHTHIHTNLPHSHAGCTHASIHSVSNFSCLAIRFGRRSCSSKRLHSIH
jgi:hypothetical protein